MPDSRPAPRIFEVDVAQGVLDDLAGRLATVRWPDEAPDGGWRYGTDLGYLRRLVDYWRDGYDWRTHEAVLNAFPQYRVPLAGVELHYLHVPGRGPDPMPLLLSHGWPGSVYEFHRLIPLLTDPGAHGADPADAFTVVAPSLPGYTFSFAPGQRRFGVEAISEAFAELMVDVLGYPRFAAQGGDWGAFVASRLGYTHAEKLVGIHLNLLAVRRDPDLVGSATPEERRFRTELETFLREETGYQWIQGTRPQTLAYGLTDSPVGLAAWLVEKFQRWSDCRGDLDAWLGRDVVLTSIMLYWVTGAIGSSFWPYYARMHGAWPIPAGERIAVPTAYSAFPAEILRPPRSVAETVYGNIQRWTEHERGGHFAALEQPAALAQDIRAFFRTLR